VDLPGHQTPKQLKFSNCLDAGQECADKARFDQSNYRSEAAQVLCTQTLVVALDDLIKLANRIDQLLVLGQTMLCLQLVRHRSTTKRDTVVSIEGPQLVNHPVLDQLVEALQELSAEIVMEEVDETEAKGLFTFTRVPVAHMVEVDTLVH